MVDYFDSSVFVATLSEDDPQHNKCGQAWDQSEGRAMYAHGLLEAFATLTGKRHPACLKPADAVLTLCEYSVGVNIIQFTPQELLQLLEESRSLGVRGGAIYDYFHICAARKAGAERIFTLNKRHFVAIAPDLAHRIINPSESC